jgi:hypothetical protein
VITDQTPEAKPTQMPLSKETQDLLKEHIRRINAFFSVTFSVRQNMEFVDRAYQREKDLTSENWRAKMANKYGDPTKQQNMAVPIVQPMVDSMASYLSGVFLSGTPLFPVVGDRNTEDAALMYETIMDENAKHGGWVRELSIFFKDCLKYNVGACEVDWKKETMYSLDPLAVNQQGQEPKQKPVVWEGNAIKRWDLYNSVWDTRCAPAELHKYGEFAGTTVPMSATRLKQFIQDLDGRIAANVNDVLGGAVDFATMGNAAGGKFFIPQINMQSLVPHPVDGIDWFQVAGLTTNDTNRIPTINAVGTYYLRLIPENFKMKVPQRNSPQIWKIIIINNTHIIFAERCTNMHNWLPVLFAQPLEDGLNYQTKSYAQNAETFQDVGTTIWNASLAAQRRSVYDRIFYDPSRIRKEDIDSRNPIARIPVKSNAYGKPVTEAFSHSSFTNDQFPVVLQQLGQINQMANLALGSNPAQQGQFVKGNKTQHEYQDVMGHSNDRQQTMALFLEAQFFYPLKQMLKLNIMQFASSGQIFSYAQKQQVSIDPLQLRVASVDFEVSDGMLPTDRIIAADTFQVMLQAIASSPQMQTEFDLVGMMVYYFKTQGARNIDQFKFTPEQQQQRIAMQQQVAQAQQPQQQVQPQQTQSPQQLP